MRISSRITRGLLVIVAGIFFGLAAQAQDDVASWDRAVSLYKQGQYKESVAEFKRFLAEYPTHAESWKFSGLAHYQLKQYDEAITELQKAWDLKKAEGRTDNDILLGLSRCHLGLNHYEQALAPLENLAKQQPTVGTNFYLLGVAYANLGRKNEAVTALQTATKLDPKDAEAWYALGALHLRSENLDGAIAALRGGTAAVPTHLAMTNLLAEVLVRRGLTEQDTGKANAYYDEAVKTAVKLKTLRDDAASMELLGRIYLAAKKYTSAELTLSRALTMSKEPTATLYFNLGMAHAQNRAWNKAAEMLVQADKLQAANVDTLSYLGYVYENLRKYPQALDAYNRAFEASGRTNAELRESISRVTPMVKP